MSENQTVESAHAPGHHIGWNVTFAISCPVHAAVRLVGDFVGEDLVFGLVGYDGGVIHGIVPFVSAQRSRLPLRSLVALSARMYLVRYSALNDPLLHHGKG